LFLNLISFEKKQVIRFNRNAEHADLADSRGFFYFCKIENSIQTASFLLFFLVFFVIFLCELLGFKYLTNLFKNKQLHKRQENAQKIKDLKKK